MTQIKVLKGYSNIQLETEVNKFLNENNEKIEVSDIKFSSCYNGTGHTIYAMVIYKTIE